MRAGVFTLALSLIGIGGVLLAGNLGYLRLTEVLRWWPLVILMLGVEILVRHSWARARGGPATLVWDRVSVVLVVLLCLALAGGHAVAVALDQVGFSWAWDAGWFPTVKVERSLTGSLDVDEGTTDLEIPSDMFRTVQITGGAERVEVGLSVTQPGRSQQEAEGLAAQWALRVVRDGPTVSVQVDHPPVTSGRLRGNSRLLVRVPSRLAVRVTNEHGPVEVRGVAGCRVSDRFGEVRVEDVAGAVEVVNEHGPVTVVASGSQQATVSVENGFAPVGISRARGPVRVRNRHGEVRVEWETAPASECRLETEFAALEVFLPAEAAVRLDAETRFGRIAGPPGWNVGTEVREPEYAAARGSVGQGGFPLILRNRHGNITILTR
ncbi:MAG: DUF5668 domain-containing protein [Bacillota bacterium]